MPPSGAASHMDPSRRPAPARPLLQTHFPVPRIDPAAYRLRVHGDAVEREVEWSLDDLKKLPSVTLPRAIECGENGRVFFAIQYKKQMDGAQWRLGGIGVAEWTGCPCAPSSSARASSRAPAT